MVKNSRQYVAGAVNISESLKSCSKELLVYPSLQRTGRLNVFVYIRKMDSTYNHCDPVILIQTWCTVLLYVLMYSCYSNITSTEVFIITSKSYNRIYQELGCGLFTRQHKFHGELKIVAKYIRSEWGELSHTFHFNYYYFLSLFLAHTVKFWVHKGWTEHFQHYSFWPCI